MRKFGKSKRNLREEQPVHYWQSMADVVSCTLLIFILLASIAAFSSWHDGNRAADTSRNINTETGESDVGPFHADNAESRAGRGPEESHGAGRDANAGGGGKDTENGSGGQPEVKDLGPGNTSAVRVQLLDKDSGQAIQEAGVSFALYTSENHKLELHTYYPNLVSYQQFKTEQDGSFYLPEKLAAGGYILHELTAPTGYGVSADVSFQVNEGHSWSDPILVNVALGQATGVFKLHLTDARTGNPVPGVEYQILAAETLDGGKVKSGDVCASLMTDAGGDAVSDALYLGKYEIRQMTAADGYAMPDSTSVVSLQESSPEQPQEVELAADQTRLTLLLTDHKRGTGLGSAVFTLTDAEGNISGTYTTDAQGKLELVKLSKNTTYTLTETTAPDGYVPINQPVSFAVDGDGHINGKTNASMALENRAQKSELVLFIEGFLPQTPQAVWMAGLIGAAVLILLLWLLWHRHKTHGKDRTSW
jgi:uncharacterized surface anchored protein